MYGFADNAKYLFFQLTNQHPEIKAVWICKHKKDILLIRQLGFEAYHPYKDLQGLYHCLTSKVYVCTVNAGDISTCLSGGAFLVNLWHGVGLKKIKWLDEESIKNRWDVNTEYPEKSFLLKIKAFPILFRNPEALLVPSDFQAKAIFIPAFRIDPSRIIYGPYPRNSILLMNEKCRRNYMEEYETHSLKLISLIQTYKKTYIYMPTWRNNDADFIKESGIEWNRLSESLRHNDALLILKMHYHTRLDMSELKKCSNIILFPPSVDVYRILPYTDCLITDYSSVYCDYVLMNKEVILFTFDYESYILVTVKK